jgi:uncharacterized delta-60 repeat protein
VSFADADHARRNKDGAFFEHLRQGTFILALESGRHTAMAVQPDGKIVAAGTTSDAEHEYFALARFNTDGSVDGSFGSDGQVATEFFGLANPACALDLQPDGKIVAAGYAYSATSGTIYDSAIARYNTDGSLDTSFGVEGKVTTDFFSNFDIAFAMSTVSKDSEHELK